MFPNQVILSQVRPRKEVRIDHLEEIGSQYEFPSGTYAYTTETQQVYLFSKPVSIESFWLRLHQPPQAYKTEEYGSRLVSIYNGNTLVNSAVYQLWSDEWYLISPKSNDMVIGDRLVIEAGTDLDSLVIQWG